MKRVIDLEQRNYKNTQTFGYTKDILPTLKNNRTWTIRNYSTVWIGSVHNIPNYLTVGGLLTLGLSVMQVFFAIISASIILAAVMILNGHAGSKYGLPFSMLLRSSYGHNGALIMGVMRGIIAAIMWFGLQTFAGSQALLILIGKTWPPFLQLGGAWQLLGLSLPQLISFILFWCLNIAFIFGGMSLLSKFSNVLSPLVYLVFGGMTIWAIQLAGGIGPIIHHQGSEPNLNELVLLLSAITAILAAWAAPMVSISDFTRMARSQKDQAIGQALGLIIPYILFAFSSISIIIGSEIAFGTPIWNVLDVINRFDNEFAIGLAVLTLCLTTVSVNVTGNIIPAGYQLAALFPKRLNLSSGAMIAAVLGIIIMPWKLMENAGSILIFLNSIGAILGPLTGVMLAHYFIIARTEIDLNALYSKSETYHYLNGFNVKALISTGAAGTLCLLGQFIGFFNPLYQISWIAGTGMAAALYILFELPNLSSSHHRHM